MVRDRLVQGSASARVGREPTDPRTLHNNASQAKLRMCGNSLHVGLGARVPKRRIYRTPPIAEAVCEIRYASDDWDPTIPGRMQERLSDRYDGKPQEQRLFQADLMHVDAPDGSGLGIQGRQQNRIQLRDQSSTFVLSLAENVLSISDLAPYSGWESFRDRIEEAVRTYSDLALPQGVTRIGVRYINHVFVAADVDSLGEYFKVAPLPSPDLGASMHTFLLRSESQYDDGVGLTVTFARSESGPAESAFVLDLDVWTESEMEADTEPTLRVITDLRDRERIAFEQHITDKARSLFNGDL